MSTSNRKKSAELICNAVSFIDSAAKELLANDLHTADMCALQDARYDFIAEVLKHSPELFFAAELGLRPVPEAQS